MSETWPRWQGRIGSLKGWVGFVGLFALVILLSLIPKLQTALNNPTEPQRVQIGQLVREEIATDQYIEVAGIALYPLAYEETESDKLVASYYGLLDEATGELIFVRTTQPLPTVEQEAVTIAGMTHAVPADYRPTMESDLPLLRDAGLTATTNLYLAGGEKPAKTNTLILAIVGLGLLLVLCVVALFFPRTVFRPQPVDAMAVPVTGTSVARATGRFQKLKQLEPSIEPGRGTRRFQEGNANLVPLDTQRLMVYIHYVLRQTLAGVVPLFRQESHWAVIVDPSNTRDVEPGKLYGLRERWAVRMRYQDQKNKPQALILSFDEAGAQAGFLSALQEMGFPVGTGSPASA